MAWLLTDLFRRRSPLRPEQEVGIEIEEGDRKGVYTSTIREVSDNTLTLAAPVENNQPLALKPGTKARVFYTDRERIYTFESEVSDYKSKPAPTLILIRPEPGAELKRTVRNQRGRFVRSFRVEYRVVPRLARYLADTREISEESVILSTDRPLEINTILDMNISLPDGLGPIWTMGTVNESHIAEYDKWRRTQHYKVVVSYLPGKLSADDRRRIENLARIT